MRLIDADKLYPDVMTQRGALAISQGQLAYAPTVCDIDEMRMKIREDIIKITPSWYDDAARSTFSTEVLQIIDKYMKRESK